MKMSILIFSGIFVEVISAYYTNKIGLVGEPTYE